MSRQPVIKNMRLALRTRAAFSTTSRAMAGGDTGAPKPGGAYAEDAFSKREKANEDYSIRVREKEKLLDLRRKIAEQHAHLKNLEEHLDDIQKNRLDFKPEDKK